MKFIRKILGAIILLIDSLTRPRPLKRSVEDQAQVDAKTNNYTLYQFHACPFCVKVRRTLHRLNLNVQLLDAQTKKYEDELQASIFNDQSAPNFSANR